MFTLMILTPMMFIVIPVTVVICILLMKIASSDTALGRSFASIKPMTAVKIAIIVPLVLLLVMFCVPKVIYLGFKLMRYICIVCLIALIYFILRK